MLLRGLLNRMVAWLCALCILLLMNHPAFFHNFDLVFIQSLICALFLEDYSTVPAAVSIGAIPQDE